MKTKSFLAVLLISVSAARGDVPIPGDPAPVTERYIETSADPNIEPGTDTATSLGKLYPLASVPAQVVFHPKVLSRLGVLQQMGDKAVNEAKKAEPDFDYTGAVISAQTWARKLGASEQKFWVFQISYSKGPKGKPMESPTAVAYFVSGAYTFHEGKKTFKVDANPSNHFPFLGTFEPKPGAFSIPTP